MDDISPGSVRACRELFESIKEAYRHLENTSKEIAKKIETSGLVPSVLLESAAREMDALAVRQNALLDSAWLEGCSAESAGDIDTALRNASRMDAAQNSQTVLTHFRNFRCSDDERKLELFYYVEPAASAAECFDPEKISMEAHNMGVERVALLEKAFAMENLMDGYSLLMDNKDVLGNSSITFLFARGAIENDGALDADTVDDFKTAGIITAERKDGSFVTALDENAEEEEAETPSPQDGQSDEAEQNADAPSVSDENSACADTEDETAQAQTSDEKNGDTELQIQPGENAFLDLESVEVTTETSAKGRKPFSSQRFARDMTADRVALLSRAREAGYLDDYDLTRRLTDRENAVRANAEVQRLFRDGYLERVCLNGTSPMFRLSDNGYAAFEKSDARRAMGRLWPEYKKRPKASREDITSLQTMAAFAGLFRTGHIFGHHPGLHMRVFDGEMCAWIAEPALGASDIPMAAICIQDTGTACFELAESLIRRFTTERPETRCFLVTAFSQNQAVAQCGWLQQELALCGMESPEIWWTTCADSLIRRYGSSQTLTDRAFMGVAESDKTDTEDLKPDVPEDASSSQMEQKKGAPAADTEAMSPRREMPPVQIKAIPRDKNHGRGGKKKKGGGAAKNAVNSTSIADESSMTQPAARPVPESVFSASDNGAPETNWRENIQEMLSRSRIAHAMAYARAAAEVQPEAEAEMRMLAYALRDPAETCDYRSDRVIDVFNRLDTPGAETMLLAAALRSVFYDRSAQDYTVDSLMDMVDQLSCGKTWPALKNAVHLSGAFRKEYRCGLDRFAGYRHTDADSRRRMAEQARRSLENIYRDYIQGCPKEKRKNRRFLEAKKYILSLDGEFAAMFRAALQGGGETEIAELWLREKLILDNEPCTSENLDAAKVDAMVAEAWQAGAEKVRLHKKSSDVVGSLRSNLSQLVRKLGGALADYVNVSLDMKNADAASTDARTNRDLDTMAAYLHQAESELNPAERPYDAVLKALIQEMKARLDGTWEAGSNRRFYLPLLGTGTLHLDENLLPAVKSVAGIPHMRAAALILQDSRCDERMSMDDILTCTLHGTEDSDGHIICNDFGTARVILSCRVSAGDGSDAETEKLLDDGSEFAAMQAAAEFESFTEDVELAQCCGQIDNFSQTAHKEAILQIAHNWYQNTLETENYGWFSRILEAFRREIVQNAESRKREMADMLSDLRKIEDPCMDAALCESAFKRVQEYVDAGNYSAAEDLINRIASGDLNESEYELPDCFEEFLMQFDAFYRATSNPDTPLASQYRVSAVPGCENRAGQALIESWPADSGAPASRIASVLRSLGFGHCSVGERTSRQGFALYQARPYEGSADSVRSPLPLFGSAVREQGFDVMYCEGAPSAERIVELCQKHCIRPAVVFFNGALSLANRRDLAKRMKSAGMPNACIVIDRPAAAWLAAHHQDTSILYRTLAVTLPYAYYQPYIKKSADATPPEMFVGRRRELDAIVSVHGPNLLYGGRQLGKSALLRRAGEIVESRKDDSRGVIIDVKGKNSTQTAHAVSEMLVDAGVLPAGKETGDWDALCRSIRQRLADRDETIPYLLLMLDEADAFIEAENETGYTSIDALRALQTQSGGRFKFVIAGLRNIVRFKKRALENNSPLAQLDSLTIRPMKAGEARELLEFPLHFLGFRFPEGREGDAIVSNILGSTNYFPGLVQAYSANLIESMRDGNGGFSPTRTPPYRISREQVKKVLLRQNIRSEIREKFLITLHVGDDDFYYILALLAAYLMYDKGGCTPVVFDDIVGLAQEMSIEKISSLERQEILALLDEMTELNVLSKSNKDGYRFTRTSFLTMLGSKEDVTDALYGYIS